MNEINIVNPLLISPLNHTLKRLPALVLAPVLLWTGVPAHAQAKDTSVHFMMRNGMGLIEFCRSAGLVSDAQAKAAIARRVKAAESLPRGLWAPNAEQAEQWGREGKWGQRQVPVDQHIKLIGQSRKEFCSEQVE